MLRLSSIKELYADKGVALINKLGGIKMIRLIERWVLLSLMMLNISGITSATAEEFANDSENQMFAFIPKLKTKAMPVVLLF